jgi:hypothetical protein
VLERSDGTSSLVASLSLAIELGKGHIDVMTTNGDRWEAGSALITALSPFLELETELVLLGSWHNTDLTEGQLDAL